MIGELGTQYTALWGKSSAARQLFISLTLTLLLARSMGKKKQSRTNINKGYFKKKHPQFGKKLGNVGSFKKGQRGTSTFYALDKAPQSGSVQRLNTDMYNKVVRKSIGYSLSMPNAENRPGIAKLLRPSKTRESDLSSEYMHQRDESDGEMRLINNTRSAEMWNSAYKGHTERGECEAPNFSIHKEIKKGLGWKQSLKCNNCSYMTGFFKLYNEVQHKGPGAKRAACNVGLQVGLQDSPIGNTKARMLLASTNTPPPSRSGMQRLSNSVGKTITHLNRDDMRARRVQAREINSKRGLPAEDPINIGFDVRYNSNKIVSSHKMGQNASQAIGVVIEKQTDSQQIIGVYLENKLCWAGSWLRNNGFEVQCPGHPDCTATINEHDPLSEKNMGQKVGEDLAGDGLAIRYVVTDGDARSADGVRQAMERVFPGCTVERQADTTHLGLSLFRHVIRAQFSDGMFPGQTADRRKEQQKIFGLDLRTRCQSVMSVLYQNHAGNMHAIAKKMPLIVTTMVDCYSGDCRGCRCNGIVCGGGKRTGWWRKSPYLWNSGLRALNMTDADRSTLRRLINVRLGVDALRLTRFNLNTNKNESVNRALSVSLPKNVTYSRNAVARANSTVHRLNLGAGNSLLRKLETVGSPITKGRYVARAVKQMQKESKYHLSYAKNKAIQRRKQYNRIRKMREYLRAKNLRRLNTGYRKGQLDPILENPLQAEGPSTSTYCLRSRKPHKAEHDDHPYMKPLHYL